MKSANDITTKLFEVRELESNGAFFNWILNKLNNKQLLKE